MKVGSMFDPYTGYVKLQPRTSDVPYRPRKQIASEEEPRTCLECPMKTCRGNVCKRLAAVRRRMKNDDSV